MAFKRMQAALFAALSLAGAGVAQAQSNVAISGSLDIGFYRGTDSKLNIGTIQRSHLQFAGTEDLGGGLTATFRLRQRFDLDTGALEGPSSKPFWHGESTVGLKGSFGSVRLGRAVDAIQSQDWAFDPWGNYSRIASPAWDLWHWNYSADPHGGGSGRVANAIFYDSPNMGGAEFHLSISPEKGAGDLNRTTAASVVYSKGPVKALLGVGKNSAGATDRMLGLRGKINDLSLMGAYNVSKTLAGSTAKVTTLGAEYALDSIKLKAGLGQVDVDGVKRKKVSSLGASYALSKRTRTYVDIASKRNHGSGSQSTYGVGLTHNF